MDVQSVRTLFAYNRRANRLLLAAAADLSPVEIDRDLRGSFASIKGAFRHLLWGERSWLRFWREADFGPALSPSEFPDLPSIVAGWNLLEEEKDAFVRELSDQKLAWRHDVGKDSYVLGELIQHAVNHSAITGARSFSCCGSSAGRRPSRASGSS